VLNPKSSKILKELIKVTSVTQKKKEDDAKFLGRLTRASAPGKLDDDDFEKLEEETQKWTIEAIDALNAKEPIPDFPDMKSEEEDEEEENEEEDNGDDEDEEEEEEENGDEEEEEGEEENGEEEEEEEEGKDEEEEDNGDDEDEEEEEVELPDEDTVREMKSKALQKVIDDHKLDVDLDDYEKLSKKRNAVIIALADAEDPGDDDEEENDNEEEDKPMKTTKKTSKKTKTAEKKTTPRKKSVTTRVYEEVCINEEITTDKIIKKLKKEGLTAKKETVDGLRSWVRQILRILDGLGRLKPVKK